MQPVTREHRVALISQAFLAADGLTCEVINTVEKDAGGQERGKT
ncbi:MAG: hypothetical protein ACJ8AG_24695 [Ktedonobacteraceae bacterium]